MGHRPRALRRRHHDHARDIAGLAAITEDKVYVVTSNYAYEIDATGRGWIHLILGMFVALAGVYVLSGQLWAWIVGITIAVLSAIANFFFIPYYPFWALLIIALDVFVIWALATYRAAPTCRRRSGATALARPYGKPGERLFLIL